MLRIELSGEAIDLLPARAVWWPARGTLLIADLHLGKAAAFRDAGVPVPEHATRRDLDRLDQLIDAHRPGRLVVLGDLLHARAGRSADVLDAVGTWRRRHAALDLLLIRGNHDRRAGDPPDTWNVRCADNGLADGPFVYRHEPQNDPRGYVLSGHLHPRIMLSGASGSALRAPCFWMSPRVGVLPAFGSFTGAHAIRPSPADRVFVVGEHEVVEARRPGAAPAARAESATLRLNKDRASGRR